MNGMMMQKKGEMGREKGREGIMGEGGRRAITLLVFR